MKSFLQQLAEEVIRNGSPNVIQPGDTILIRLDPSVTLDSYEEISTVLKEALPYNPVVIINAEEVFVIRRPE